MFDEREMIAPGSGGMAAIFECISCGKSFPRTIWGQVECLECISKKSEEKEEASK